MNKLLLKLLIATAFIIPASIVMADNAVVTKLMNNYQSLGASAGNAKKGQQLWNTSFAGKTPFTERSCKSCHTSNLSNTGEHIRTGKKLKPLAPSKNAKSLSSEKKIKKWLKRNCKWTTGNECSIQQRADILAFISQQ